MDIANKNTQHAPVEVAASANTLLKTSRVLDKTSPWFVGHFPLQPILPGVAQLGMVYDLIASRGKKMPCVRGLSRVKFKKVVRPGEALDIQAEYCDKDGRYFFRITQGNEEVCCGVMTCGSPDQY